MSECPFNDKLRLSRLTLLGDGSTAMRVPFIPLHLFAGYQYVPLPEIDGHYGDDIRETHSMGFSLGIKENISIQGSVDNCSWKFEGTNENFNKFSLGVSIHDIPGF